MPGAQKKHNHSSLLFTYVLPMLLWVTICSVLLVSMSGCATSHGSYTRSSFKEKTRKKKSSKSTPHTQNLQPQSIAQKKTLADDTSSQEIQDTTSPSQNKAKTVLNVSKKKKTSVTHKNRLFERRLRRVVASFLGVRYRYGGTSRRGMDCSGFVYRVYQAMGKKDFPRTSSAHMMKMGRSVKKRNARVGDLIFFRNGRRINHVGIYMGNKKFAHASSKKGITYTSIYNEYFSKRYVCIRRIF